MHTPSVSRPVVAFGGVEWICGGGMMELVDISALKADGAQVPCGFESHSRYQFPVILAVISAASRSLDQSTRDRKLLRIVVYRGQSRRSLKRIVQPGPQIPTKKQLLPQ